MAIRSVYLTLAFSILSTWVACSLADSVYGDRHLTTEFSADQMRTRAGQLRAGKGGLNLAKNWKIGVSATGAGTVLVQSVFHLTATLPLDETGKQEMGTIEWAVEAPFPIPVQCVPAGNTACDLTITPYVGSSAGLPIWVTAVVKDANGDIRLANQSKIDLTCSSINVPGNVTMDSGNSGQSHLTFPGFSGVIQYPSGLPGHRKNTIALAAALPLNGSSYIVLTGHGVSHQYKDPPPLQGTVAVYELPLDDGFQLRDNQILWDQSTQINVFPATEVGAKAFLTIE